MPDRSALICGYLRTPIGRYGGALAGLRPDDMAAQALRALLGRTGLPGEAVDEVIFGCANQAGEDNRNVARMASLLAGLPETVPALTINRLCASGLDAVVAGARAIRCGEADIVLAGGVESMTRAPIVMPKPEAAWSRRAEAYDTTIGWRFVNPRLAEAFGTDSMPETAENVAEERSIARADQDAFALRSQRRTEAAREAGWFDDEIVPVRVTDGRGREATVEADEHPRPQATLDALRALPAPFRKGGTVTAGNASGVNDGAAVLLLASKEAASAHGLQPLAAVEASASVGVAPRVMGLGPVPAVQRLLDRTGRTLSEFGAIELNEAFAAQALACLRELGLDDEAPHVNPKGGAIALGHPLGATGARLAGVAARLAHGSRRPALATLCVGVGQGVATSFVPV
jgi:3-oxoadipyl-CoA thiolase